MVSLLNGILQCEKIINFVLHHVRSLLYPVSINFNGSMRIFMIYFTNTFRNFGKEAQDVFTRLASHLAISLSLPTQFSFCRLNCMTFVKCQTTSACHRCLQKLNCFGRDRLMARCEASLVKTS